MKIKRERQVRLDGLMKYAWDNNITRTRFEGKDCSIYVDDRGNFKVADEYSLWKSNLYTFTEEVEITEEAKLSIVIIDRYDYIANERNFSINDATRIYDGIKYIYLQNEDGSIGELIWKSGKLI